MFRLSGVSPFLGRTTDETYLNITQGKGANFSTEIWTSVSNYAKNWISRLLVKDSKQRMTVAEALAHPWLNVSGHWRSLVKNIGGEPKYWGQPKFWGKPKYWERKKVSITDEIIGICQLLGGLLPGLPPKVYAYVSVHGHTRRITKSLWIRRLE